MLKARFFFVLLLWRQARAVQNTDFYVWEDGEEGNRKVGMDHYSGLKSFLSPAPEQPWFPPLLPVAALQPPAWRMQPVLPARSIFFKQMLQPFPLQKSIKQPSSFPVCACFAPC